MIIEVIVASAQRTRLQINRRPANHQKQRHTTPVTSSAYLDISDRAVELVSNACVVEQHGEPVLLKKNVLDLSIEHTVLGVLAHQIQRVTGQVSM